MVAVEVVEGDPEADAAHGCNPGPSFEIEAGVVADEVVLVQSDGEQIAALSQQARETGLAPELEVEALVGRP